MCLTGNCFSAARGQYPPGHEKRPLWLVALNSTFFSVLITRFFLGTWQMTWRITEAPQFIDWVHWALHCSVSDSWILSLMGYLLEFWMWNLFLDKGKFLNWAIYFWQEKFLSWIYGGGVIFIIFYCFRMTHV